MFNALRVALCFAAAYHAQADGQSEQTNQTAEIWLRHWTSLHPTEDWPVSLPSLTAAMNSAVSARRNKLPEDNRHEHVTTQPAQTEHQIDPLLLSTWQTAVLTSSVHLRAMSPNK